MVKPGKVNATDVGALLKIHRLIFFAKLTFSVPSPKVTVTSPSSATSMVLVVTVDPSSLSIIDFQWLNKFVTSLGSDGQLVNDEGTDPVKSNPSKQLRSSFLNAIKVIFEDVIVVTGKFSSVVIVTLSGVVPAILSTVNLFDKLSMIKISPTFGIVLTFETLNVLSFVVKV